MSSRRGYTIVELLMAITVLAIGITGIVAMQKITVAANQHARSLSVATHVAQAWQEQLATDATQWNHPSPNVALDDLTDTRWLQLVGTGWFQPAYDATADFGPGFDGLGNVVTVANMGQAVFCTHLRLTWLYPSTAGNGLIRTEVRVFWVREGMGGTVDGNPVCAGADPTDIEQNSERYHFVYQTSAVKQNTAL